MGLERWRNEHPQCDVSLSRHLQVGVAVAPVPDQQLYDTIYQERYMGLPKDNADGYRRGSAINFAERLKGKLLIVHGSGDTTCTIREPSGW